jgi:hypothetical protein
MQKARYIKHISIPEAVQIAKDMGIGITYPTAIKWCRDNKLGYQPGGGKGKRWYIKQELWTNFLKGGK